MHIINVKILCELVKYNCKYEDNKFNQIQHFHKVSL